ncbi:MAG TPA: hypothetical protein VJV78_10815 [Polyangiales bacterium]|nr:hypothetical protein [Polyangiales bacterium]
MNKLAFLSILLVVGCASGKASLEVNTAQQAAQDQAQKKGTGDPRCDATLPNRESNEYDTSGNDQPDVRKVFLRVGDPGASRLVLICREADVNGDGKKDVVRIYDDEGRSLREDVDRNFDGKIDQHTYFQNGQIVRHEFDDNFDGKIETKVYYDNGKPSRAERDLAGRSTPAQWRPDRWEYFDAGKTVRMGTDLDGDARVDRWDRDAAWKKSQEQPATAAAAGSDG